MESEFKLDHKIRVVTAASLFDGHDAAINIMRRVMQDLGAEIIHLGHNRSVQDVVDAAIQEDAQAIAVSSYQGGHVEYFKYMRQLLDEAGAQHIRIFGGGGGVIVPDEIRELEDGFVDRIYSPEDGRRLGLEGILRDLLQRADFFPADRAPLDLGALDQDGQIARAISLLEASQDGEADVSELRTYIQEHMQNVPVLGLTGTGGAGKSSLTDELLRRFQWDNKVGRIAVLSVDPTRRRSGGALLGDRIRMNALDGQKVFMRSLATRSRKGELSAAIDDAVALCKASGFDLIVIETSGIGQGDADITDIADVALYVMTPEYGAPSQLEKIDMLDFADLVVVNKFGKRGALDALRDVRKQVRRNRKLFHADDADLPVYGTSAARFADEGVTALYHAILAKLREETEKPWPSDLPGADVRHSVNQPPIVPADRQRYLAEISSTVRGYHATTASEAKLAREHQALVRSAALLDGPVSAELEKKASELWDQLKPESRSFLSGWDDLKAQYTQPEFVYSVRGREIRQPLYRESLSHQQIPRVAVPLETEDAGDLLRYGRSENVPGAFPYTGGVFPLKRTGEDPKRMFAGEGGPARTNARFHYLCKGETAHRLSTAFDSVTLYGEDPAERPDIFGKVGESGVSVPHFEDMKILYSGFDLCAPTTSVSMTINGPAPILLAMFFNTAIDQQVERFVAENNRQPTEAEWQDIAADAQRRVRGTVQADILKEDQAQNTCIFSTEFALKMMGDIQQYFVENGVRNFYSVSISGYHIAEAGANPITQVALTLANGFTLVEYYLARGMPIDAFAANLSFFFSNGLDPEYSVIGRVARRIWAVAMRDLYGANSRSQKLKYHIQTSGRSLHAREIQFNDIRTTLQALMAIEDNCNSLHTNAYDEAITTPTEESVRRAMAIQMIINRELGIAKNENPTQGAYFTEQLTNQVEEAILQEFERISDRGGVLGAMELQYQRMKIQEESLYYETLKHNGELPIIGVNTFLDPKTMADDWEPETPELRRATPAEKMDQIESVRKFQAAHADTSADALARLKQVALEGGNVFAELMVAVRHCTLGQITNALYDVGGEYRRNL